MGSGSPGVYSVIFCVMYVMYVAFCVKVVFGEETASGKFKTINKVPVLRA